jgi:hypothetical protein
LRLCGRTEIRAHQDTARSQSEPPLIYVVIGRRVTIEASSPVLPVIAWAPPPWPRPAPRRDLSTVDRLRRIPRLRRAEGDRGVAWDGHDGGRAPRAVKFVAGPRRRPYRMLRERIGNRQPEPSGRNRTRGRAFELIRTTGPDPHSSSAAVYRPADHGLFAVRWASNKPAQGRLDPWSESNGTR